MSYSPITDFSLGVRNNSDYQKKNPLSSTNSNSSSSFGELVSFYKNDTKGFETGNSFNDYNNSSDVRTPDYNNSDVKNNESLKSENKVDNPEDSGRCTVEKNSEKSVKDEGSVSKKDSVSPEEPKEESLSKKEALVSEDDSKTKAELDKNNKKIKNQKDKKLTEKDFSRIDEMTGNFSQEANVISHENKNNTKNTDKLNKDKSVNNLKNKTVSSSKELLDENEKKSEIELDKNIDNLAALNKASKSDKGSEEISDGEDEKKDSFSDMDLKAGSKDSDDKIFMDKEKKISVEDLRTEKADSLDSKDDKKAGMKVSEPKLVNENTANITMELKQNVNSNVMSSNNQTAASNGSNFQAMLNNQVQQSASEFVKAGNLILKDNNQGTINLLLRPDDLGNVKLHLSLDGKTISGHITVATKEAFEVFKDNTETLREAFIKSGFDSASFDVSYGGNSSAGQEMAFEQKNDGSEFVGRKVYESHSENADGDFDKIVEKNEHNKEYSINIVA